VTYINISAHINKISLDTLYLFSSNTTQKSRLLFRCIQDKHIEYIACFSVASKTNTSNTLLVFLSHTTQTNRLHCLHFQSIRHEQIHYVACLLEPSNTNEASTLLVFWIQWHPHPHLPHHAICILIALVAVYATTLNCGTKMLYQVWT
jgi:hypothetical protein